MAGIGGPAGQPGMPSSNQALGFRAVHNQLDFLRVHTHGALKSAKTPSSPAVNVDCIHSGIARDDRRLFSSSRRESGKSRFERTPSFPLSLTSQT